MSYQKLRTRQAWRNMRYRCYREKNWNYRHYGGRGITVCERWHTYENFLEDMGLVPDDYSLDRIDSNGNYEPGNCRWADKTTQMRNRRNVLLSPRGMPWSVEARENDIPQQTFSRRVNKLGWSHEKAATTPLTIVQDPEIRRKAKELGISAKYYRRWKKAGRI